MTDQPSLSEAGADAAVARQDLETAQELLRRATSETPKRVDAWLKLAAICRATGDLPAALVAVTGALRVDPLGFLPLLLKASLLDASGAEEEAGETYGYALAQQPDVIPDHLRETVARATVRHAEHVERSARRLAAASLVVEQNANPAECRRIERFRSNIVRRTRPYHSEPTHFHYPGLREREFHDRDDFPWLTELEAACDAITADFHRAIAAEHIELVPYIQYPDDVPVRQWATLNRSRDWSAIHLVRNGGAVEANARHCHSTMALLDRLDQPMIAGHSPNAMFSLLAPGARIPPHTGVANTRLVCHLPLIVPDGCWFRVGAERREWRTGQAWVFDDTIEHEALNPSDALRVILIVDTWHPDLSPAERAAVTAVTEASGIGAEGGI